MSRVNIRLIIGLCVLLCGLQWIGRDYFYFDRDLVAQGQLWRLLTAHFVHLNLTHLLLNIGGLSLVLVIFDKTWSLTTWLLLIVISAMLQSLAFYAFLPRVQGYVGFSGVIHSLYVAGAMYLLMQTKEKQFAIMLCALLTVKLLTEQIGQGISMTEQAIGGHVLIEAHLFGAIIGMMFSLIKVALEKYIHE